jgi:hypothetical protein
MHQRIDDLACGDGSLHVNIISRGLAHLVSTGDRFGVKQPGR